MSLQLDGKADTAAHLSAIWPLGGAQVRALNGAIGGLVVPSVQIVLALPDGHASAVPAARQGLASLAQILQVPLPGVGDDRADDAQAVTGLVRQWMGLLFGALQKISPLLGGNVPISTAF